MSKHYRTLVIASLSLFTLGLSVAPSAPGVTGGFVIQWGVSAAWAEDSESHSYGADGYDEKGFDREGHDRGGYNRDGYDKQGHDHEGYDKEGFKDDGHNRDGHYDSGRDRHGRHDKPQGTTPTSGAAQPFKAKPSVKQY